jgi:hypothetical protein
MQIQVMVCWVVTRCSVVVKMKAEWSSHLSVSYHITTGRHNPQDAWLNSHKLTEAKLDIYNMVYILVVKVNDNVHTGELI